MGRPPIHGKTLMRIDAMVLPSDLRWLDSLAADAGVTRSAYIRRLIERHIQRVTEPA